MSPVPIAAEVPVNPGLQPVEAIVHPSRVLRPEEGAACPAPRLLNVLFKGPKPDRSAPPAVRASPIPAMSKDHKIPRLIARPRDPRPPPNDPRFPRSAHNRHPALRLPCSCLRSRRSVPNPSPALRFPRSCHRFPPSVHRRVVTLLAYGRTVRATRIVPTSATVRDPMGQTDRPLCLATLLMQDRPGRAVITGQAV